MDNKKIIKICIIVIILLIASMSIYMGIYFTKLSKPNYLFGVGIDRLDSKIDNYLNLDEKYNLGDTFEVKSTIDFDLSSEDYLKKSKTDKEAKEKLNIINNLTASNNEITISQDKKHKKLLLSIESKIKDEELINYKYLVSDSTEYYFINDILKNYVNNGTSNYFEMLSENTSIDNLNYIHEFTINSLKKNLKEEYFNKYRTDENINGSKTNVNQISIRLTDKMIHEILNGILSDLKEDKKSNKILSSIDEGFSKTKIKSSKEYLKKNESYTINVYTSKYLNKILKYELIYLKGDEKKVYTYEGSESEGTIYYIENDNVIYNMKFTDTGKIIEVTINNSSNQKIGDIKLEKNDDNSYYTFNFDDGDLKYDLIYSSKYTKYKKNKSYHNEKKLSFKYIDNKVSILSGSVSADIDAYNKVKIDEDISNAVLSSTLNEDSKKKIDNRLDKLKERLKK